MQSTNVKVKEISERNYTNVNVTSKKPNKKTIQQVSAIAKNLERKFNSPKDYEFFCKCAWHLSENEIWSIADAATTTKRIASPVRYFTAACRNQLRLRGY